MKTPFKILGCTVASLLALLSTTHAAVTLVSDNFTNVTNLNADGWYSVHNLTGGAPWSLATNNKSPLSGTVAEASGNSSNNGTALLKQWNAVTLTSVGDYIQFSLDFNVTATATAGQLNIRLLGGIDTLSANLLGYGGTTGIASPYATDAGYSFQDNYSQTSPYSFTYREVKNDVATSIAGNVTTPVSINNSAHSLLYRIEYVATGLKISATIDGNVLASYTDTTPATYTFNTLSINPGSLNSSGVNLDVDNISVTASVPEPSVAGLMVVAATGVFIWKNKFQKLQA